MQGARVSTYQPATALSRSRSRIGLRGFLLVTAFLRNTQTFLRKSEDKAAEKFIFMLYNRELGAEIN
jgi:hypothetical protein